MTARQLLVKMTLCEEEQQQEEENSNTSKQTQQQQKLAIVINTGSFTLRGEMLCDVIFGRRSKIFKFDIEVTIVLALGDQPVFGVYYAIGIVGVRVHAAINSNSESLSAERLRRLHRITVSDPHGILMAGIVHVALLDKTGTLTEPWLDFHSAVLSSSSSSAGEEKEEEKKQHPTGALRRAMSVCHSQQSH